MRTAPALIQDAPDMETAGSVSPIIEEWENLRGVCSLPKRKEPGTDPLKNWQRIENKFGRFGVGSRKLALSGSGVES